MIAPPRLAERLLRRAVRASPYAEDIVGDLHEAFAAVREDHAAIYAAWWYRAQAIRLIARFALRRSPSFRTQGHVMDRFVMDVRLAARSLMKRPMLAATVIGTLALGIGANAAVFGVIDALVLHPFTLRDVDRVVMPVQTLPNDDDKRESVSAANFLDWRRDTAGGAVRDLSAFQWWEANLMGRDEPEHASGFRVTASFFSALSATPALGRVFLPEDETTGGHRKVVLSDGLWRRRFGADPGIVGQPVLVDGAQSEVVGVMPPGFDFPMGTEIWAPLAFDSKTPPRRSGGWLTVIGRLAPGKTIADAQAEMSVINARLVRDFPRENKDHGMTVHSLVNGMRDGGIGQILSLWQAAGLFVLLIACANIANLLLARGAERGRETAVRLAARRRLERRPDADRAGGAARRHRPGVELPSGAARCVGRPNCRAQKRMSGPRMVSCSQTSSSSARSTPGPKRTSPRARSTRPASSRWSRPTMPAACSPGCGRARASECSSTARTRRPPARS
jgi:hypothetical protein